MGKKVLILDAGVALFQAKGELNHHYVAMAKEILEAKGYEVSVTRVAEPYDIPTEQAKLHETDYVIVQTPGFWMGTPWQLKKYEDECFGSMAEGGDGRHRSDPNSKYGTGGIHTSKHYMVCSTWNAPAEAFTDPDQFFEGRGIDGALMQLHKTFAFIGMQKMPSFVANDVLKNPTHEADFARFKAHIESNFA